MMKGHVLIIDDEQEACDLLELSLSRHGWRITTTTNAGRGLDIVASEEVDVVLTELHMPVMSGLDVCERVHGTRPSTPVILITGEATMESAVDAMRVHAFDFIRKPVDPKVLFLSVSRAMQARYLQDEITRLRRLAPAPSVAEGEVVGRSSAMRRVYELIARVADSEASVLIHGETGTGKEMVARSIHACSRRKDAPFVAINCAAVPPSLIESELFGHARGAFTDAKSDRKGLFVQASGGTLFLDEIGELPLDMQPKLLRALQERKVRPVGANVEIPFDSRIIAASNRNLEDEVYEGRFREDLFYRVNVVKIDVPPLRERSGDVLDLARAFIAQFAARNGRPPIELSASAAQKLAAYGWPGNVRELENCIEHAVALARLEQITVEDLPEKVRAYRPERFTAATVSDSDALVTMDELERRYIARILTLVRGNKSRAAQVLGFDRRTLYRKLERLNEHAGPEIASVRPHAIAAVADDDSWPATG